MQTLQCYIVTVDANAHAPHRICCLWNSSALKAMNSSCQVKQELCFQTILHTIELYQMGAHLVWNDHATCAPILLQPFSSVAPFMSDMSTFSWTANLLINLVYTSSPNPCPQPKPCHLKMHFLYRIPYILYPKPALHFNPLESGTNQRGKMVWSPSGQLLLQTLSLWIQAHAHRIILTAF